MAAISLGECVQGVGTRVARVGGRCAIVCLTNEWHCVLYIGGPLLSMHKVPVSQSCPA